MQTDKSLRAKYESLLPHLNEREVRLVLVADAKSMGRGGISKFANLSGKTRVTLNAGLQDLELKSGKEPLVKRSRKIGGEEKKQQNWIKIYLRQLKIL